MLPLDISNKDSGLSDLIGLSVLVLGSIVIALSSRITLGWVIFTSVFGLLLLAGLLILVLLWMISHGY
jgi:hypothetical protein